MKNYIIGALAAISIFLVTVIYKQNHTLVLTQFPVSGEVSESNSNSEFHLYLFFSGNSCSTCLKEVVSVLNGISDSYNIAGAIPETEFNNQDQIRKRIGALFPLHSIEKYRRYLPVHTPTLVCATSLGKVLFVLPVFAGQVKIIENYLKSTSINKLSALKD